MKNLGRIAFAFIIGLLAIILGFVFSSQITFKRQAKAQNIEENSNDKNDHLTSLEINKKLEPQKTQNELDQLDEVEDVKTMEDSVEYRYEPVGKRDPFRPYRDSKIGIGQIRSGARTLEPLEKFDLKVLEVIAIIWANDKPKALIQDPEKNVHSVIKGQRIGRNDGYIAEIREGEVIVIELYDLNGKTVKEPFVMCIDKKKGCGVQ